VIVIVLLNLPLFSLENSGFFWPQKSRPTGGKARLLENNDQARFLILKSGKNGASDGPAVIRIAQESMCSAHHPCSRGSG
jgi:hypothetical protein